LPYAKRPEHIIPGRPQYYRTSTFTGTGVAGLHVESHMGRPTKIEGNPDHPMSNPNGVLKAGGGKAYGATSTLSQASILDLYDPERSQKPRHNGEESSWAAFSEWSAEHFRGLSNDRGRGLALLIETRPSPTFLRILEDLTRIYPQAKVYRYDAAIPGNAEAGLAAVTNTRYAARYDFSKADRIVSLDCDFLGTEGDVTRNSALFSSRRDPDHGEMNRLYSVSPVLTLTSAAADNRLAVSSAMVGRFARSLASALATELDQLDYDTRSRMAIPASEGPVGEWVEAIAADLLAHRGDSLIVVGERQPAWVHQLGHFMNSALGNIGNSIEYVQGIDYPSDGTIEDLATAIEANEVDTLVCITANPAYTAPANLNFAAKLERVSHFVHAGAMVDETGALAEWHLPLSHYLECWSDWVDSQGNISVQQPLISPIYETKSEIEVVANIVRAGRTTMYEQEAEAAGEGDLGYQLVRASAGIARGGSDEFEA
ncbi:MAG: hypothetical protein KC561_18550, partial [Myxococcales bacterium]|nr:hypothetical protein [Myxococcales bacterium]